MEAVDAVVGVVVVGAAATDVAAAAIDLSSGAFLILPLEDGRD